MKNMKKILALVVAVLMIVASVSALAQTVGTATDNTATITINNPAKGETYKVHKLFDATVTSAGGIAYTATSIPEGLGDFFEIKNGYVYPKDAIAEKDAQGNITGTKMTDALKTALESWATDSNKTAEAVSDGAELVFQGLPYGYYVMTTTHKGDAAEGQTAKAAISVTSTTPNATINDKNSNTPTATKEVNDDTVSVGDTVIYTATFDAPNYMPEKNGAEGESEQVVSYTITDTLPEFLTDVKIMSVQIQQPGVATNVTLDAFTNGTFDATSKSITVPWVVETVPTQDHKYTSLYKAGSKIIVQYSAKLTAAAKVGAANINEVSLMPNVDRGNNGPEPYQEHSDWKDDAKVYTHAAALQKKANSENGDNLAGAEFSFKGLIVTGVPGFYTVVSYDKSTNAAAGTVMKCDANGKLVIAGIDADSTTAIKLVGTETKAPEGYNKIVGTFDLTTTVMSEETTTSWGEKTTYYDADGNIVDQSVTGGSSTTRKEITSISDLPAASIQPVVNKQGTELPSTGGMGTTILYVGGSILVILAAVLLITKRRMNAND